MVKMIVHLRYVISCRELWVGWQGNDGGREKRESVVTTDM